MLPAAREKKVLVHNLGWASRWAPACKGADWHWGHGRMRQALGTGRTAAARGWHGSLQSSWPHQHPGPCSVLGQKSSSSGLLECYSWVQTNNFCWNSQGEKVLLFIWVFWGETQSALTRTRVDPDKSSVRMCCERPPKQLPRVWDFGQSPQQEEQTPQPELMETGENNCIVSCGFLSMLRPRAFPSRAHADFCYSFASFYQLHLLQWVIVQKAHFY